MNDIKVIKIELIDDFPNHPFKVNEDDELKELAKSIKENGLLNPLIVRTKTDGRYELISGHRRKKALELIGEGYAEVYVKDLTEQAATNYDAIKHQGRTLRNDCTKLRSDQKLANDYKESARTIQNYIRLTNLIPELLQLVDNTVLFDKRTHLTMGILPAIELSYLKINEQKVVYDLIEYEQVTPSHSQTKEIRKLSEMNKISFNVLDELFLQNKGNQNDKISFNKVKIESVLPSNLKNRDKRYIEEYIIEAIKKFNKKS